MSETREQYIEREFSKWEEEYEISFNEKFKIKSLLALQHQYSNTADEHVRTKKDLLDAIYKIDNNLRLKKKNCLLFLIETSMKKEGETELLIFKMDLTTGRNYKVSTTGGSFDYLSNQLVDQILSDRPKQVIFGATGNAYSYYQSTTSIWRKLRIEDDGIVNYYV